MCEATGTSVPVLERVIEGGAVPTAAGRACRTSYLQRELDLVPNAVVVALRAKARDRMKGIKREVVAAVAAAPSR